MAAPGAPSSGLAGRASQRQEQAAWQVPWAARRRHLGEPGPTRRMCSSTEHALHPQDKARCPGSPAPHGPAPCGPAVGPELTGLSLLRSRLYSPDRKVCTRAVQGRGGLPRKHSRRRRPALDAGEAGRQAGRLIGRQGCRAGKQCPATDGQPGWIRRAPPDLHQWPAVRQALQRRVHEARVAQVAKARQPVAPALALQAGGRVPSIQEQLLAAW